MLINPTRQPETLNRVSSLSVALCAAIVLLPLFAGCASTRCAPGKNQVSSDLQSRVHSGLGPLQCNSDALIPDDVSLQDGVTADEAVAVALWNNSAFNATLARLGMARGDLVQAGLLTNPQFNLLLPGGTKQLEWTMYLPVESLLLRETRLDMSEREVCRVAQELVQNGLNLVRDVRVAHAGLVFAVDRAALANEAVDVRKHVADLTEKRLNAGDISELEATTARIEFLRAKADAAGFRHAVAQADAVLRQLMSVGTLSDSLIPVADPDGFQTEHDLQALIAEATSSRPDLQAATFAADAARRRAELSRWQWLRLDMVADANAGGAGNSNFGPGFRFDIPIFNKNQGGVQTADWTVYQATQNYNAVRDQVIADVQTAYSQVLQAEENLAILQADVIPSIQEALNLANKAYLDGGAPYFLVLQTTSQFLDSRTRELEVTADLRRAKANLDRGVGRKLQSNLTETIPFIPASTEAMDAAQTQLVSQTSAAQQATSTDSEPGILLISKDGSSLFSGATNRV